MGTMTPFHRGGKSHLASILLLYAYGRDLVHLKEEERDVCARLDEKILHNLGIRSFTDPHIEDGNRLIEAVKKRKEDLLFLSYSGHADGEFLKLEHTPARAEGFAGIVQECKNLKCILLNGCNTHEQVEFFHRAGIPVVIATHTSVKDADAKVFAVEFFRVLVEGKTLREACQSAEKVLASFKDTEEFKFHPFERTRGFDIDHEPGEPFYGLSYLKEKEGLLDLSLLGFMRELSTIQAFEGKPRYQNILFIGNPNPESCPHISKSLEIIFRKRKYNCMFFNPDDYWIPRDYGCGQLKRYLKKAGKVVFLIDQSEKSLKFYNNTDGFFDACLKTVNRSSLPVEVGFMNLREYREATRKLAEEIPHIRRFPEAEYFEDYHAIGSGVNINHIEYDLGKWLGREVDAIREHLDNIDLDHQRNQIDKFLRSQERHSKVNLLAIPADERSEWELLLKFTRSYLPNPRPVRPFSYSSKFIGAPNSLQEFCGRIMGEFQFDISGDVSIEQAFFQNLKAQLEASPVFWVIRDVDLEGEAWEVLVSFWKKLNHFFDGEPHGHSLYMVWVCHAEKEDARSNWGEIENFPGNVCPVEPITLLDDAMLDSWITSFYKRTKIHIDRQHFSLPISLREAVRIACRQLNQDSLELEVFRF